MRGRSNILCVVVLVMGTVQGAFGSREIKQFSNEPRNIIVGPDSDDYNPGVTICYSPLDVLSLLNSTDNLTYFQEALYYSGIADILADPLALLTILAPSDDAFLQAADTLGMPIDVLLSSPVIIPVLLNHILDGPTLTADFSNNEVLITGLGQYLNVSATNGSLIFSSAAASAEVIDADKCNCELCSSVIDVIDTVLLPDILNITTEGAETLVVIGNPSGTDQFFLVIDESLLEAGSPAASPTTGPATKSSTSQALTGITLAPTTSTSTRGQGTSTSTGMTYYTNTAANS